MKISTNGQVALGCQPNSNYRLAVDGVIGARKIKVTQETWADFVFKPEYKLRSLQEVELHIREHGYLPDVPSEKEVKENGVDMGEMDKKLLQKIEELTLYIIELNKKIEVLEKKK